MKGAVVNAEAAVIHHTGYAIFVTITRITPSGQVTVAWEGYDGGKQSKRFDAEGYEIGSGSKYRRDRLRLDVEDVRRERAEEERKHLACATIRLIKVPDVRPTWSKSSLVEAITLLEVQLAEAKKLVEAI